MPWKEQPTRGILKGFVRNANLLPIDGARVTIQAARSGRRWTHYADGTGFYAFVDLPPDTYAVEVTETARGDNTHVEPQKVTVQPGKVATYSIVTAPTGVTTQAAGQVRLRNVTVVLGTDTYPGNLYARDTNDKTGLCLHVRLQSAPLIPFQPGDIIDVLGTPGIVDGEPVLDNAAVCLNDIALEVETASIPVVPLNSLTSPPLATHGFARVRGVVTQADAGGFTLTGEKTSGAMEQSQIRIPLAGRKDFGVEAGGWTGLRPAVGSIMEVTGLVTTAIPTAKGTRQFRLLPRGSTDVTLIAPPPPPVQSASRLLRVIIGLLVLLLVALWAGRKRLRRRVVRPGKTL